MAHDDAAPSRTRRSFLAAVGAAGALGLAGCTQSQDSGNTTTAGGLSGDITITGSSTVFPLATAVKEAFESRHSGVSISISPTGSGGGFTNHFCVDQSDINNASRPIKQSEEDLCEENGVEWHEIEVATDALTVIVNNDADWVDCMTFDELEQIWRPDGASTWSEVRSGWPDEEFDLYGPTSASGTFDYFTEEVVGEGGSHRQDYSATEQDRTIVQGVEGSQYAMGYLGFAYYSENTDRVKAVPLESEDGECVAPELETAKSGAYPLSRPLFTYPSMDALAERHIAEFCRFFTEKSADRELVADQVGYVPNSAEAMQSELDELNAAIEDAGGS